MCMFFNTIVVKLQTFAQAHKICTMQSFHINGIYTHNIRHSVSKLIGALHMKANKSCIHSTCELTTTVDVSMRSGVECMREM